MGTGLIDELSEKECEYNASIHNGIYMFAALGKWTVLWGTSVYLGQQWWRSIELDPKVNDALATNSFNAMVFVMAFLFSGNLTKFIKTRDTWGDTLLELRHLALYLSKHHANDTNVIVVIKDACSLVLAAKYHAAVSRQKADLVGTKLVGIINLLGREATPAKPNNFDATQWRKDFYSKCGEFLTNESNPNKMARADALIKASYRAQYDMATPNVADSVQLVASALLCFVSMAVAADQDDLHEAYIVTAATVGTIAIPFAVSALVSSGSFSLFKSQFSEPIDPEFQESLEIIAQILGLRAPAQSKTRARFANLDAPPRFYKL
jgi:hypothetical protein